jgi:hypothetical protein
MKRIISPNKMAETISKLLMIPLTEKDMRINIGNLDEYLREELQSASDKYRYLNKNHNSLSDYTNKLNAILAASTILSKNINTLSRISKIVKPVNVFGAMERMISTIKDNVEALKKATDGFVRIKTRKNINGNVTTTIITNNPENSTGEVVIKVNETYFKKPVSSTTLDRRSEESFRRMQKKISTLTNNNNNNTTGGKHRTKRARRNSKKTRRVKKHRGTRRV